ncbi:MAG: phosphonate C-P lyase system protein PhnL [Aquabacterium sp.]|nr:phosphonate C-P lyase system protein PhnL [Aquabacterium sp.]
MTTQPVLDVQQLAKGFHLHLRGGLHLPVLQGVSMQVHAGECVALVGPSGRGKSTLLRCLYGSYGIDSGHAWLRPRAGVGEAAPPAVDLAQAHAHEVIELRRRALAHVSQFLRVVPRVPTLDIVAERAWQAADGSTARDDVRERARAAAAELLEALSLPRPLWSLPPATFSGGEQQRVNIARALVVPSRLLLLDEPTASLDAGNRRTVVDLIRRVMAAGTAVVGIFHDEEVRDALATRQVHLGEPADRMHA